MNTNNFYKPSGRVKDSSRTYVPDLYRQVAAEMDAEAGSPSTAERQVRLQQRPLVGVLYSISAGTDGELFPVYVGRNTIGSDPSCDICLREASVSSVHGLLLARKQVSDMGGDYINVSLSDNNSIYGTTLNGEPLGYDKAECKDGDIIVIGQNYEFVLSLFNAVNRLTVSADFERLPEPDDESGINRDSQDSDGAVVAPADTASGSHSTNITVDSTPGGPSNFYRPSQKPGGDHYNNKTIIQ